MEYEIDVKLVHPRKDVCGLMKEACRQGKKVYITTDTYYNKGQILNILNQCGVTDFQEVLISCEYGTDKAHQLFDRLIDKAGTNNILHIGDDIVADIQSAKAHGLKVCQLYSGAKLLDAVGGLGLFEHTDSLCDRVKIGMFVADIFNSPFQFEEENSRIGIPDAYDVGYLCCAPMISDFVVWFNRRIKEEKIRNIWFCARDGYLIRKMSQIWEQDQRSSYFLTSRIAAIRAGMESREDIAYVDGMKFSGTLAENLKQRFGLMAGQISLEDTKSSETGLLKYEKSILERAHILKGNYHKYIDGLDVQEGAIAFFDFVAKGTSQMYVDRIVDHHLKGFYFLQLEPDYMRDKYLDIEPFYTTGETDTSMIYDNYYILETLLTAPHPSVHEFDEAGRPVYTTETRSPEDIACFQRAQDGILDYFKRLTDIVPKDMLKENKKLDEVFLALIHGLSILDREFLSLTVEDPFFHRMTSITDVL